jgi:protoporphyrinogen/coproporphyrinogen III oxidase
VARHQTPRAVVVGGGIAGLAAAYRLQRLATDAGTEVDVTLLEASDRLGGKIQTERGDGLVIEYGPDSFLSYKPAATKLAAALGIEDRVIGTRESGGGTYILRDGRLEPLPEGITMLVPTRLRPLAGSRLLSIRAKLRMAAEVFVPPKQDDADESLASFISRRLGREAFERMAQPLLSGIYAGDAEQLSLAATFPRLRDIEREHGSLVRGMLAQRRARKAGTGAPPPKYPPFVSFETGMADLVDGLLANLERVDVRTGCAVERLSAVSGGYHVHLSGGETIDAGTVLLATPAYASADIIEPLDGSLSALLRRIPYVSTATISLGFRRAQLGRAEIGRGFVIPQVEGCELTAVTWASNKFAGRAPEDLALLRTFVGRAGREEAVELPDDELMALARRELRDILGIEATPEIARIARWRRAMPQYVLGHVERLARIDEHVAGLPGIFLLGAAYRGVGIPDCIEGGNQAADRAWASLLA